MPPTCARPLCNDVDGGVKGMRALPVLRLGTGSGGRARLKARTQRRATDSGPLPSRRSATAVQVPLDTRPLRRRPALPGPHAWHCQAPTHGGLSGAPRGADGMWARRSRRKERGRQENECQKALTGGAQTGRRIKAGGGRRVPGHLQAPCLSSWGVHWPLRSFAGPCLHVNPRAQGHPPGRIQRAGPERPNPLRNIGFYRHHDPDRAPQVGHPWIAKQPQKTAGAF